MKRWIQGALKHHRRGALHRHYGIESRKKIPMSLLVRDQHAPGRLGQQVRFALGRRGFYKKKSYARSRKRYGAR